MGALESIHEELRKVLRENPNDPYALMEDARELVMLSQYDRAADSARLALRLDPNSWGAAVFFIEAASHSGRCKEAKPLIVPTIKTGGDQLLGNANLMYAAASCYLEAGETATAESVLKALLQRTPEVRTDPTFRQLVTQLTDA